MDNNNINNDSTNNNTTTNTTTTNTTNNNTTTNSTNNNTTNNNTSTNTTTTNTTLNNTSNTQPTNNNSSNNNSNTEPTNNNTTVVLDEMIIKPGLIIHNNQQIHTDIDVTTETTFNTTDPINNVPIINEDLVEVVNYNNDTEPNTETALLVNQIRQYALQIKCDDFHGKGSIDDYTELFMAASKIADDTKQMQLDIDVDGFTEFGKAADDLSNLFINFTKKLQNINIINDSFFLQSVLDALKKIANLSDVFGRFKQTILVTSEIKIPKSAHDTKIILEGVMDEVNCAMNYINNFVEPDTTLISAQLSDTDKDIISKAVTTIEHWQVLSEQGVSIALNNNSDMIYLKNTNIQLKQKTSVLNNVTLKLKAKLALMNVL